MVRRYTILRAHRSPQRAPFLAVASGVVCIAAAANASTVIPMTLQTMSDHAGQVITGTVTSVRSYWTGSPRRIESVITLSHVEYLRGALPDSTGEFTLVVPGGTIGRTRMQITCAPVLRVGERWLLFLLPTYKTFPVVGLSQGAFRLKTDAAGIERVMSAASKPLIGIDGRGFARFAGGLPDGVQAPEGNRPGRANVRESAADTQNEDRQGMTLSRFLVRLRPILDSSRDRKLTLPSGRRVPVEYVPRPLRFLRDSRPADDGLSPVQRTTGHEQAGGH